MRIRAPERANKKLRTLLERVNADKQLKGWWHVANVNATVRMEINDHSWVHIQIVTNIALKLLRQLTKHGVEPSLVRDFGMTNDDAEIVVTLGALLHDVGMSVHREGHEDFSLFLVEPEIRELLDGIYEEPELTVITSEVLQAIISHRADGKPLSLEAGIVRVADALDMAKGRSRIPFEHGRVSMHSLSAAAIDDVDDHGRRGAADQDRDPDEQLVGHLPGRRPAEGEAARVGPGAVRRGDRAHRHRGGEAPRADLPARDLAESSSHRSRSCCSAGRFAAAPDRPSPGRTTSPDRRSSAAPARRAGRSARGPRPLTAHARHQHVEDQQVDLLLVERDRRRRALRLAGTTS